MNNEPTEKESQSNSSASDMLHAVDNVAAGRVRSRIMSVSGTLIVWMPVFILIVFAVHGAATGAPLPLLLYPLILRVLWVPCAVGGLMLIFPARHAQLPRWTIGALSLSIAVFALSGALISGKQVFDLDASHLVRAGDIVLAATSVAAVLCMLALNFLSVMLVVRVFRKNGSPPDENKM